MFESTDAPAEHREQGPDSSFDAEYWRQCAEASQASLQRLMVRLRGREKRIQLLERALARTAVMHHMWALHLERKLDRTTAIAPTEKSGDASISSRGNGDGVVVKLPHMNATLASLFEVMWSHWSHWDLEHPPKSSVVARAIDEKLGWKCQANGEASRRAQTIAAAMRPDSINETDGRHQHRMRSN
ncbi:hypothetical protein [Paraburkholderia azotifigens]|uniref:Uncharacterized protein n=1 Tax=Paraburkholderia azotifigens TaxID=2057004 RepID=A0ABU9R9H0_9BURK